MARCAIEACESGWNTSAFKPERGRWILFAGCMAPSACTGGMGKQPPDQRALFGSPPALAIDCAWQLSTGAARGDAGWHSCSAGHRRLSLRALPDHCCAARPHLESPASVISAMSRRQPLPRHSPRSHQHAANDMVRMSWKMRRPADERCGGELRVVRDASLASQFPLVAAVGQGSRGPRLLDLRLPAGGRHHAGGQGVCFDTAGST